MFGFYRVIADSLVRQFEQTGISINAQDRRYVRKQRQDKTVYLHPRIYVAVLASHCRCYTPQCFKQVDKNKNQNK